MLVCMRMNLSMPICARLVPSSRGFQPRAKDKHEKVGSQKFIGAEICACLLQLNLLQKLDKFAIKRVVERIRFLDCEVLVAFEIMGAFSADVNPKNFVACG